MRFCQRGPATQEDGSALVSPLSFDYFDHAKVRGVLDSAEDNIGLFEGKSRITINCEQEEANVFCCGKRIPANENIARLRFQQKRCKVVKAPGQKLPLNDDVEMFGQIYEGVRNGCER